MSTIGAVRATRRNRVPGRLMATVLRIWTGMWSRFFGMAIVDPHRQRYLIVRTVPFQRTKIERTAVVWGHELPFYQNSGWQMIAEDPEPTRYDGQTDDEA